MFLGGPEPTLFTLSKAIKLREVILWLGSQRVEWVTMALQTIGREHRDLKRISIEVHPFLTIIPASTYPNVGQVIGEGNVRQWLDLDRSLVHLQESRSIRTRVIRPWSRPNADFLDSFGDLLPEITKRGMIGLAR